ncbi:22512_t:CDS:2, partial [Racocetra persica]
NNEILTNSSRTSLQPKLITLNILTTSSQSTTSAQATKLNVLLESNSLPKKRKLLTNNKSQLEHLSRGYAKLEYLINKQRLQLKNILKKLDDIGEIYNSVEIKSKEKKASKKTADYLFQEAIRQLSSELFHKYKQISDKEMKKQLKNKLKNDKDCAKQLQYEYTHANAIWTQAILELIFDENYLSTKLDSDVVDTWYQKLLKKANDI